MNIISVSGYGSSGSSAVVDFIRQYDYVYFNEKNAEFQFLQMPDGILDLKHSLTDGTGRISSNNAIIRFEKAMKKSFFAYACRDRLGAKYDVILDDYLNKIKLIQWKGKSMFDPFDVSIESQNVFVRKVNNKIETFLRKTVNKDANFPSFKNRYFSMMTKEKFDQITKDFIDKLICEIGNGNTEKVLLLDQLFSVENPLKGTEYFDDIKTIIVNRDPRCMYVDSRRLLNSNLFMPCDNVENFVNYYNILQEVEIQSSKALYVNYDALIYDYYNTTQKIMEYLGVDYRPEHEFKYFNPNVSVQYTFPKRNDYIEEDIHYIEKHLSNYLYDFTEYTAIQNAIECN